MSYTRVCEPPHYEYTRGISAREYPRGLLSNISPMLTGRSTGTSDLKQPIWMACDWPQHGGRVPQIDPDVRSRNEPRRLGGLILIAWHFSFSPAQELRSIA